MTLVRRARNTVVLVAKTIRRRVLGREGGGGHTESALYCYGVWLRHLVACAEHAGATPPKAVAEIGPGRSLGACLAAMLSGADRAVAFDTIRYAAVDLNVQILDELVELFTRRAPIPQEDTLPRIFPPLAGYAFPGHILTADVLAASLHPMRIAAIRDAIRTGQPSRGVTIQYVAPWDVRSAPPTADLDLVFSQAVMLYVKEIDDVYGAVAQWLRPGGITSHTINFTSVGVTPAWDGHWNLDDESWELVEGPRSYGLSRFAFSDHMSAMRRASLDAVYVVRDPADPTGTRDALASRFRYLTDEDRTTLRAFIIARCA